VELCQIPQNWVEAKLGDIVVIEYGNGLPKKRRTVAGHVEVYGSNGVVGYHDKAITNGPTIVIGRKGSVGAVNKSHGPCWPIDTTYYIDRVPAGVVLDYLFHYLKSRPLASLDRSTTIPGINRNDLYNTEILLPPTPEQKRIVAKIEALFAKSKTAREALDRIPALLQRFRQSVLARAFKGELTQRDLNDEPAQKLMERIQQERRKIGLIFSTKNGGGSVDLPRLPETWVWTTIGQLETFIGSGITPRGGKKVYKSDGIPFIRSQNVYPDGLHLENVAHITPQMHAEMKRTQVHPNDVLLNITGASIGRSAFIQEEFDEANVNQHVCIVRTGWWIVPAFLSHFLNSTYGQDQIFAAEAGVTREGLNYTQVRSIFIPLAPLAEQRRIVARIREVIAYADRVNTSVQKAQERVDKIDHAILKRAFAGELVSQDPNDEPASVLLRRIKAQESPMKASERKKHARFRESTYREHNKPLAHITSILREMGEATVEQVYDASGRSMENFWDELARDVKAGTIQEIRKGHIIYLKVKD